MPSDAVAHDDKIVEKLNEVHTFYCSFHKPKNLCVLETSSRISEVLNNPSGFLKEIIAVFLSNYYLTCS